MLRKQYQTLVMMFVVSSVENIKQMYEYLSYSYSILDCATSTYFVRYETLFGLLYVCKSNITSRIPINVQISNFPKIIKYIFDLYEYLTRI